MPKLPELLTPLVGEPVSEAFALLLVLHVLAGLTCVATGLVAFWIGPSLIGLPIVMRALHRHAHLAADLRATRRVLAVLAHTGSPGH